MTLTATLDRYVELHGTDGHLTTGERYMIRKQISNLYREAKAHEDRANEESHITALRLRAEANDLNEELRRAK